MVIKSKYLVFPVNTRLGLKDVTFSLGGRVVYKLKMKLDGLNPDFYAYVDVSRFMGEEIEIKSELIGDFKLVEASRVECSGGVCKVVLPDSDDGDGVAVGEKMSITAGKSKAFGCSAPTIYVRESDTMDLVGLYHEILRPWVHFTTKNGWINDPNGLIFVNGKYHLFYQHNPCDKYWENMHWGHAVSDDMIHWEEKDIALFPDDSGTMYSGSAIVDENNLLGYGDKDSKAVILYHTATAKYTQNIAYSVDDMKTFLKPENNAVVPHIVGCNRDPKVVYCDELSAYVMALYLEGATYGLLKSTNLRDWELVQKLTVEGENECPDFFPMLAEDGTRKWVLMGARDKYVLGDFVDGLFVQSQNAVCLRMGRNGYAGQTFSNLPDMRRVRIDWDKSGFMADTFGGMMDFPTEFKLIKVGDEYRISSLPIEEIEGLYGDRAAQYNTKIHNDLIFTLSKKAYQGKIEGEFSDCKKLTVSVFGHSFTLDFENNKFLKKDGKDLFTCELSRDKKNFSVEFIVDVGSIEIYIDGGLYNMYFTSAISDYNLPYIQLTTSEKYNLRHLEINELKSIWER